MKQFIVVDQMNRELTDKGRQRLLSWAMSKKYLTLHNTTFSIGQMIEFLDEQHYLIALRRTTNTENLNSWDWEIIAQLEKSLSINNELCDALWEAVKQVLEA
jgi:hypothetical protein